MKRILLVLASIAAGVVALAQPPGQFGFGPGGGPGGQGFGGPGGPGGPNQEERKILKEFDSNENGWLEASERIAAREAAKVQPEAGPNRGGGRGPGGRGPGGRGPGGRGPGGRGPGGRGPGGGGTAVPPKPGKPVSPESVEVFQDAELYAPNVMRTIFLRFENEDWEKELEDFHGTDVDVPALLTVDGVDYPNVGVHFRGMSSYHHVQSGSKRSLNVSLDLADEDQRLYGYKTLNLLNSHGDPSMMSSVVYSHIARQYIPAPKANFVHVVINGESWGLYDSVQQFDKIFLKENFDGSKGTRWKVSGNPGADGGLRYLGEDLEQYKSRFEMKSNDGKKAWLALIELCRVLNETPLENLESALEPILDIDGALKFLALDNALVNGDGYWTRASDYSLFRDADGKFHVLPHDMNEAFVLSSHGGGPGGRGGPPGGRGPRGEEQPGQDQRGERPRGEDRPEGPPGGFGFGPPPGFGELFGGGPEAGGRGPGGPGGRGGPGHGGVDLDPLIGLDNERMPLRSRLLSVPALRERYLEYVDQIARESLNWNNLGPVVDGFRDLVAPVVKEDTRMLSTYDAFVSATRSGSEEPSAESSQMSLQKFAKERSKFLLSREK